MPITRNVLQEPNQDEDPDTDLWLDTTDPQHETTPSKILSFITTRKINFNDIDQNLKSTFNHLEPEQQQTRKICQQFYQRYQGNGYLNYPKHIKFASDGLLDDLEHYFKSLDASRPWLCYWSVHALKILKTKIPSPENILSFLKHCYNFETGGFGGGPQQLSHLAPTYAAVNCIASLGIDQGYEFLKEIRPSLVKFLESVFEPELGYFLMHKNGEFDTRAAYCAISVSSLLNLDILIKQSKIDFTKTFNWLLSCQSYEGGFSGIPGAEAHGGYTWCALAGLALLDRDSVSLKKGSFKALSWLSRRQCVYEGGFNGRTNKLVDACYSFWQGSCFNIIEDYVLNMNEDSEFKSRPRKIKIGNSIALASYITGCCQNNRIGGIMDKPGKGPDYYHTCYGLSGYSFTEMADEERDHVSRVCPLFNLVEGVSESLEEYLSGR